VYFPLSTDLYCYLLWKKKQLMFCHIATMTGSVWLQAVMRRLLIFWHSRLWFPSPSFSVTSHCCWNIDASFCLDQVAPAKLTSLRNLPTTLSRCKYTKLTLHYSWLSLKPTECFLLTQIISDSLILVCCTNALNFTYLLTWLSSNALLLINAVALLWAHLILG